MRRVNVSLDTLDPRRFAEVTRGGRLGRVLDGIRAATAAGVRVKINAVALRGVNEDEIPDLLDWCIAEGHDLCLIETMPLGDVGADRADQYLPLSLVRARLRSRLDAGGKRAPHRRTCALLRRGRDRHQLGFITPLTHNFCEGCNRVRLTCTGTLYMCLGQDDAADLRQVLRSGATDTEVEEAIRAAIARKPKGHDFVIDRRTHSPSVARHMNLTGG